MQLIIESRDAALLARLKKDVLQLLAAYEDTTRDGHVKRGAGLAAQTVRIAHYDLGQSNY